MAKSIKEIAEEIGVSKQAVQKKIDNLGLTTNLKKIDNQFVINKQQETLIKSAFLKKRPTTKNRQPTDNQPTTNRQPNDTIIELLQKELEVKNEQISKLQNQLEQSYKLIDQEQQLRMVAEQKSLLLEQKADESPKTLWQKIFKTGGEKNG